MIKLIDILSEVGEATNFYSWKFDYKDSSGNVFYSFNTPQNKYIVAFADLNDNSYDITFGTDSGSSLDTNEGVSLRVISTITKITLDFIKKYNPRELIIHPIETKYKDSAGGDLYKDDLRRFKLYGEFLKKNLPSDYSLFTLGSNYRIIKK